MWYQSNQPEIKKDNIFEEYYNLPETLEDVDAKYYLAKFLRENLGFCWELLTEHKLFLWQELLINAWFKKDYSIFVACRGSGKSYLAAVFCCLYALFFPKSRIVLVANNFRTVKSIFAKIEEFLKNKNNSLLKQAFPDNMSRQPDIYTQKCDNGSVIVGLPLSGENLRGQRANVLFIDEGLLVSESVLNSVLRPFLNSNLDLDAQMSIKEIEEEMVKEGILAPEDKTRFAKNRMIICSSASYQHDAIYEKIYLPYVHGTTNHKGNLDDPSYFACRMSYEVPAESGVVMDTSIKATIEAGGENDPTFMREGRAIFTDASGGYFNARKVKEGQVPDGCWPTVQLKGEKDAIYILSIDPSYSAAPDSDFFAFSLLQLDTMEKKTFLVHSFGKAGIGGNIGEVYEYFTYLLTHFNIQWIIIDASGTEFIDSYNQSSIAKERDINLKYITADLESDEYTKELKIAKSQWNIKERCMVYPHLFSGKNNRATNEHLQSQINAGRVCFGSRLTLNDKAFNAAKNFKMPYEFLDQYGNKYDILQFIQDQDDWQSQVQAQLFLIQISVTSAGTAQYDMPEHMRQRKGDAKRPRKDNYTTLMMGVYASKHLFDMFALEDAPQVTSFQPFFV